jgi:hypothetical protein
MDDFDDVSAAAAAPATALAIASAGSQNVAPSQRASRRRTTGGQAAAGARWRDLVINQLNLTKDTPNGPSQRAPFARC